MNPITAPEPQRYRDRFTDTARHAWRAASWRAGLTGSWTQTPPPSAVAVLVALAAATEPTGGSVLARRAGVAQGRATSVHLPRLAVMGLAVSTDAEPARPGARAARLWQVTPRGAELARVLTDGVAS